MAKKQELEQELKEKDEALAQKDEALTQLKKQMEEMQKMMMQLTSEKRNSGATLGQADKSVQDRKIKIINLLGNSLNLSTEPYGGGKKFHLNGYGDSRSVKYSDLEDICHACKKFIKCFYICDTEAIIELGLEDVYEEMVTKEQMDNITNLVDEVAVEMFKGLSKELQESAITTIMEKINKGDYFDENMIFKLNQYLNYSIREKANSLKELVE